MLITSNSSTNNIDVIQRNNVKISGQGNQAIVLAHGFGCDQSMWSYLLPHLESNYTVVCFDYVGSGQSQLSLYDPERYAKLEGYALDVIELLEGLSMSSVIFVGHSVSSMIGLLASLKRPELFASLIMVCPSPCFLNIGEEYQGGFEREDLEELINLMDKNYIGWANYLAPLVMGTGHSEELTTHLTNSFCSTDPTYSKPFAKATFFSDYRHLLSESKHPCLILQSENDSLASLDIGQYVHQHLPHSSLEVIHATGHCLHMTHPETVSVYIERFITQQVKK
ncbi:alpha/beta fold hydrolase [Marinomonas profundimaris]|jgi:sigma-B regulation protein RsbQ|uniref:Sigma factor sigB regulation protein rsbQ n=1 Tax=Marinomonas profundimaris TaxID=1208321 RepID=W1RPZ8_9GAMM|nr:alpha/beta hydrolase [Marinomonas profundimaris]ETI59066.1 sigma factor sigB regulation protein rsbQ [Marinomonas profundimaris]